jgi:uncharacterized protein
MTLHISVTTTLQHLLFVFLLVIAPAWDYRDTQRLKRSPSSAGKIRYYKTLCSWLWIGSAVALMTLGWRALFTASPTPGEIPWLLEHAWVRYLVIALLIAIFTLTILFSVGIVLWKKLKKLPRKYGAADRLKSFDYFFPQTWTERRWFAFLCVTAGVCEETLYRGFLLHYLHVLPFSLNLTLALVIAAAIFGLGHLYTGLSGVLGTAAFGFLMSALFLLSGNLLLPMIFHATADLRILVLLRPPDAVSPSEAGSEGQK